MKARAAISQWILKTLYLAGGSGTEGGGRHWSGAGMRGGGGTTPGARALRVLAEDGHPEDASGQEEGRHDHVQLEEGDFRR